MPIRLNWTTLSLSTVLLAAIPAAARACAWPVQGGFGARDATFSLRYPCGHSAPLRPPAPGSRTHGTAPASTPRGGSRGGSLLSRSRFHPLNAVLPEPTPAAPPCGVAAAPVHACSATCRLDLWREAGRGPPRASPCLDPPSSSRPAPSISTIDPDPILRTPARAALAAQFPFDRFPPPPPILVTDRESVRRARHARAVPARRRDRRFTLRRTSVRPHPRVPEGGVRWAVSPSPGGNS